MNLSLLIVFPLLTAILVLLAGNSKQVRIIALTGALLQLALAIYLVVAYQMVSIPSSSEEMFFQYRHLWYPSWNIYYHVGVDGISIAMILLTAIVVLSGVLVSWNQQKDSKAFYFLLLLLSVGAYGFFVSLDLFTMFFFLELAVIPKFLLIGIWGSGKKEYSALKLALMLMFGSALVFIGMAGIYFNSTLADGTQSFDWLSIASKGLPIDIQLKFFPFIFIGFGVFTALFPFHTWVPDGHSAAPTAASMFLAGISMKLGGYGCLRVATFLMPDAALHYSPLIILAAVIAIIYGAFATMMQTDLKYINAYSSVSHCGFVLLGIGMLTKTAITGAVMQMVSHGLMTALFFACIGMIYERTHTRQVAALGGLLKVMPFISTVFVIAGLCSLGLPGLSGFVAEMTIFMGAWQRTEMAYRWATIISCASIVVTAFYILKAIGSSIMGPLTQPGFHLLKDAGWNERLAMIVLLTGILIVGIVPFFLIDLVEPGTQLIMKQVDKAFTLK